MIYMDKGIKYSERYVDTKYRMLVEESATDDAVLTSLKGQIVDDYSKSHLGFPTSIESWNGVPVRYYSTLEAEKRIKELRQLVGSLDTSEGFREFGYLPLYDAQDQYSLLRLNSQRLLEVFPDFWSDEALLDAPPLYPDRETPTLNQVTQDGGISSVARYQVSVWLQGLRRLFLDQNDRFSQTTKARTQIGTPGSSFGNGYTSYPFTGPPDTNPASREDYLFGYLQEDRNINVAGYSQLDNLLKQNARRVVQKVIDYNNQFGAESYTLEPTIRTNDQYFESLGEIFRLYSTPVDTPETAVDLIGNQAIPNITAGTQLYPYFIRSKSENIVGQQVSVPYLYNYSYGIAYKFFNQYLYNKYFNYRIDKAKLLQEINQLEKLITSNE
jgi:hypothetical protein